jgi:GAF domain-containing protein
MEAAMMHLAGHDRRHGTPSIRNLPEGGHLPPSIDIRRLPRELHRPARALRAFLHEAASAGSEAAVFEAAVHALVKHAGYRMAWVGLALQDARRSVRPVASAGFADGYLEKASITWAEDAHGKGPTGTAIRTRLPVVMQNALTDPSFVPWTVEAMRRGYAASAAIPMLTPHGGCLGAINVYATEADSFSRSEVSVLSRLASELVIALRALKL